MAHYVKHGHTPTDAEIEKHGYRAFGPAREAFTPDKADWLRALEDCATGDPDELGEVSETVAGWWPGWGWPGFYGYGFGGPIDD